MIWVIGGTKDSRDFLEKFVKYNDDIIVSTATEYGAKLIENLPVKTSSEKMDKEAMLKFVEDNKITKVVDTSHPYAFEVSKNAMEVAEEKNIEYFRFEREEVDILPKKYKQYPEWNHITEVIENKWIKSIANLTLLSGKKNIEASNSPFDKKMEKYLSGSEKNTTSFRISQQILDDYNNNKFNQKWNENALKERWLWVLTKLEEILNINCEDLKKAGEPS